MLKATTGLAAIITATSLMAITGCESSDDSDVRMSISSRETATATVEETVEEVSGYDTPSSYNKPGFVIEIEDDDGTKRLWVLRPGQEKAEKSITLIGGGPDGMTLKALDRETALDYIATKPGFDVEIEEEDGTYRMWVLLPGQEKAEKSITLIGAGPRGMTMKALSREVAQAYLAAE